MNVFRRIRSSNAEEKKASPCLTAISCLTGKVVPMKEIPDPVSHP